MTERVAADGEEIVCHASGQEWLVSWHRPDLEPTGKRHGSAGVCLFDLNVILVSGDGTRWDLPGGRSEEGETWEETLHREVFEEACATVQTARLLGYARGRCVRGREAGLVLVRSLWIADVVLADWTPTHEMLHRRLVPVAEVLQQITIEHGYFPIYRRALSEAGLP